MHRLQIKETPEKKEHKSEQPKEKEVQQPDSSEDSTQLQAAYINLIK